MPDTKQTGNGATRVPPSPLMTLTQQNTSEVIADHLRRDIATGTLREGDSLSTESELAAHFGVSTPTLRAALRILESEQFITIARGAAGGARVCHPDIEATARTMEFLLHVQGTQVREFCSVRAVLEPAAAYLFAQRQPPEGFAALEANLVAAAATFDDPVEWAAPQTAYYRVITDHCGNGVLAMLGAVLQQMLLKLANQHAEAVSREVEHEKQILFDEHREMFEILKKGNPVRAQRFWKRHIESMMERNPDYMSRQFTAFE